MTKVIKSDKSVTKQPHKDKVKYAKTIIFDIRKDCTYFDVAVKQGTTLSEIIEYLPFATFLNLLSRKVTINHYRATTYAYVAGYSKDNYTFYRFSYSD